MKELFLQCACKGEGLKLEFYKMEKNNEVGWPDELWISLWTMGFGNGKISIWQRIKFAFQLLKKGTLNTDMVILNKESIMELKKWLEGIDNE